MPNHRASGLLCAWSLPLARPGPAKLPPAAAARPRPTMPAPDAPAEPRRSSQRRAAMRGAAAAIATPSGPPRLFVTASEHPARRHASLRGQAAPAPGAERAPISGAGPGPDPQPESRRAVGCRHRYWVGSGADDLARRGLGRLAACAALGGAAGRPSAPAEAPKQPKSLLAELRSGSGAPPSVQCGTRAYLRRRGCVRRPSDPIFRACAPLPHPLAGI